MKLDRMIGILAVLLQKEKVTAPWLAEKFEVSRRTINRDIERRQNKRPMLADLRESGSIEQDADMVIFLAHHDDMHGEDDEDENVGENLAYAILAKNRNGPTGEVTLRWIPEYTKFVAYSDREEL